MHIQIKLLRLVPLFALLAACSQTNKTVDLKPIPPVIIKVPVKQKLPAEATTPCEEPHIVASDLETDVDLLGAGAQWKLTSRCNAAKLKAIEDIENQPMQQVNQ